MKKQHTLLTLLSLVLALAMCLSLAIPGFAASSSSPFAVRAPSQAVRAQKTIRTRFPV